MSQPLGEKAKKSERPILVHYNSQCYDCGMIFEGTVDEYDKCRKKAQRHANKTGHEVSWQTGYSKSIYPKKAI